MCGIAGLLGIAPALARPAAERIQRALSHRGPDDSGIEAVKSSTAAEPAMLIHTRLSIVELSPAGHQPMWDHPANGPANVVVFNGEIYNFRDLLPDLARAGHPCRSGSDTEVILQSYRAWGDDAVERFEGMFAFCLLDVGRGRAWLCRDRVGIKPLYLFRPAGGGLLFASEVRALLAAGPELVPRRLRSSALESFLAQGAVMSDRAIVEGVSLLGPGESLLCDFTGRELGRRRYWSVDFGGEHGAITSRATGAVEPGPAWRKHFRSELVADLSRALHRSVSQLLLADVPVGLFLSAGLDSSAIAAIASEVARESLHTLSVGFDIATFDESAEAELSARELGTRHQRITLSGARALESFDTVLAAADQPTVDGFNTYFISDAARQAGLTVALSGVGGDELFGGYRTFHDVPRALRLRRPLGRTPAQLGALLLERASEHARHHARARAFLKVAETLRRPADLVELYLLRRELFAASERRALLALPQASDATSGLEHEEVTMLKASHRDRDPVDRIAALEFSVYMRHMLLRDADVFGMASQLEIRVPLLEHYVVAGAARARAFWRRPDPRPKPLLVDAAGPRLPERSFKAKKRGFTFPWRAWLEGPLAQRAADGLRAGAWDRLGVDPAAVDATWRAFKSGDRRVSELQIIGLLVLETYARSHGLTA